jgi:hypothetical protein
LYGFVWSTKKHHPKQSIALSHWSETVCHQDTYKWIEPSLREPVEKAVEDSTMR